MKLKKFILPILFSLELAGCSFSLPSFSNKPSSSDNSFFDGMTDHDDFYDYEWPTFNPNITELKKNSVDFDEGIRLLEPHYIKMGYEVLSSDDKVGFSLNVSKAYNTNSFIPSKPRIYQLTKETYQENIYSNGELIKTENMSENKSQSVNYYNEEFERGFNTLKGYSYYDGASEPDIFEEVETVEQRNGQMLSIRKNAEMKDSDSFIDSNFHSFNERYEDYVISYLFHGVYDELSYALNEYFGAFYSTGLDNTEVTTDSIFSYDGKHTVEVVLKFETNTNNDGHSHKRVGESYLRYKNGFLLGGYRKIYENEKYTSGSQLKKETIYKHIEYFEGVCEELYVEFPTIELNHSESNHIYSNNFTFNDSKHFRQCVAPGCDYAIESNEHSPGNYELLDRYDKDGFSFSVYGYSTSGNAYCNCGFKMDDVPELPEEIYNHGHNPNFNHYGSDENSHWYMCNTVINGRYCDERIEPQPHIFSKVIEENGISYQECYECGCKLYIQ